MGKITTLSCGGVFDIFILLKNYATIFNRLCNVVLYGKAIFACVRMKRFCFADALFFRTYNLRRV